MRVAILWCIFSLTGCASIVGDHNYAVNVTSNTSDTEFLIKNKNGQVIAKGTTPSIVNLESSSGYFSGEKYTLESKKAGYRDGVAVLNSSVAGSYIFGNILLGGLVGWFIVDPITGAMYNLPTKVNLDMIPLDQRLVSPERLYRYQDKSLSSKLYIIMPDSQNSKNCSVTVFINNNVKAANFESGEAAYFYLFPGNYNVITKSSDGCESKKNKSVKVRVSSGETTSISI